MLPRVLHGLGGAAGFQPLISVHVHFLLCFSSASQRLVASDGVELSLFQAGTRDRAAMSLPRLCLEGRPESGGSSFFEARVNLTAQGLGWISRQLLQISCELEQLSSSVAPGEAVRVPPAEKPIGPIPSLRLCPQPPVSS